MNWILSLFYRDPHFKTKHRVRQIKFIGNVFSLNLDKTITNSKTPIQINLQAINGATINTNPSTNYQIFTRH